VIPLHLLSILFSFSDSNLFL
jgi:hypothetical protein